MKILATILIFCGLSFAQGTEIRRPSADSDPGGAATWVTTNCGTSSYQANPTSGALAWDSAGQATSVTYSISTSLLAGRKTARQFTAWQSTGNTYSSVTLYVNSQLTGAQDGGAHLVYSTNNGSTWTAFGTLSTTQQTTSVTLATTDVSMLRVGLCMGVAGADPGVGNESIKIFDIWTVGTTGAAANGNGSGSGTAVQPVQFN